jgi:hypothetical protein
MGRCHDPGVALYQGVNPKPRQRLVSAVAEDGFLWLLTTHQGKQLGDCPGPQRATALFVPLAVDQDR